MGEANSESEDPVVFASCHQGNATYRGFCDVCETTVHIDKGWYHRNGHSDLCKSHFDHLQVSEQQAYRLISIASDLEAEMHDYEKAPCVSGAQGDSALANGHGKSQSPTNA